MVVVDASALVDSLVSDGPAGAGARAALRADAHWAAPGHLPYEAVSSVRGLSLAHRIEDARAETAIAVLGRLQIEVVPAAALVTRVWELRHDLTAYDAAYVAAAELLGCTLITADLRLAGATGPRCPITVSSAPQG